LIVIDPIIMIVLSGDLIRCLPGWNFKKFREIVCYFSWI